MNFPEHVHFIFQYSSVLKDYHILAYFILFINDL